MIDPPTDFIVSLRLITGLQADCSSSGSSSSGGVWGSFLFTPAGGVLGWMNEKGSIVGIGGASAAVELTVRGVCGRENARAEELVLLLLEVRDGEGDGVRVVGA
jgi:hypothetical protein